MILSLSGGEESGCKIIMNKHTQTIQSKLFKVKFSVTFVETYRDFKHCNENSRKYNSKIYISTRRVFNKPV